MDEYYEQNNIQFGDKNFKYDVRKDFDVGSVWLIGMMIILYN